MRFHREGQAVECCRQKGQVLEQGRHWEQSGSAGELDSEEELPEAVPREALYL